MPVGPEVVIWVKPVGFSLRNVELSQWNLSWRMVMVLKQNCSPSELGQRWSVVSQSHEKEQLRLSQRTPPGREWSRQRQVRGLMCPLQTEGQLWSWVSTSALGHLWDEPLYLLNGSCLLGLGEFLSLRTKKLPLRMVPMQMVSVLQCGTYSDKHSSNVVFWSLPRL
jgi:hypothetical protein